MNRMRSFIEKFELPSFYVLALLFSWWAAPFAGGGLIPHGPAIAALIILALLKNRRVSGQFRQHVLHWRAGWWYLIGPAVILAYQGAALLLNLLLGASLAELPRLPSLALFLNLLLLGGLWEEIGWSGYALPRLRERFLERPNGLWIATLVLALGRAFWHLPLFLSGTIYWFDIAIFSIGYQVIIAWLFYRSGGSVPAVMVFHFFSNLLGAVLSPVFAGAERTTYYAIFMSLAFLIALALVYVVDQRLFLRGAGSAAAAGDTHAGHVVEG